MGPLDARTASTRLAIMKPGAVLTLIMPFWLITSAPPSRADIGEILAKFHNPENSNVMVAAHRGGYLSDTGEILPENSIPAMERSISEGAEILEIDLQITSDGHLVLMHDATVNRTTDGIGAVSSMTLAQIQELRLLGPGGVATDDRVPTFAETMALVKGRAMVNLDKLNVTHPATMAAAMQVLRDTETVDHAIFKGSASAASVQAALDPYEEEINYMPILSNASAQTIISMLQALRPPAVELIFSNDATPMLDPEVLAAARETGTRIWINSLWASLNGGHHDALAVGGDPDGSWGWIVGKGASIIQTDYAERLIEYLWQLGRRDDEPPSRPYSVDYDFRDGTLQSWENVRTSAVGAAGFVADEGTYGNRTPAVSGVFKIVHTPFLDGRDTFHHTLVLRSPEFRLHGIRERQALSFSLLGGTGGAATAPASEAALLSVASPGGFLGVALRRSGDGAYLLSARRSAAGQGSNWQRIRWSAELLSTMTGDDAPEESYTLDLIDAFGPGTAGGAVSWGWIALDAVSIPWTGAGDPKVPVIGMFDIRNMVMEWSSYPGFIYQVYRSTDLDPGAWTPASGELPATPPRNRFFIPENPLSPDREFYRVERRDAGG